MLRKDPTLMGFSLLGDESALFPEVDRQLAEDIQIALEDAVIGRESLCFLLLLPTWFWLMAWSLLLIVLCKPSGLH
jgi:hypothetical protein